MTWSLIAKRCRYSPVSVGGAIEMHEAPAAGRPGVSDAKRASPLAVPPAVAAAGAANDAGAPLLRSNRNGARVYCHLAGYCDDRSFLVASFARPQGHVPFKCTANCTARSCLSREFSSSSCHACVITGGLSFDSSVLGGTSSENELSPRAAAAAVTAAGGTPGRLLPPSGIVT